MYKNYIFDLYGTLIDLRTDEEKEELWEKLSKFYSYNGARYDKCELKNNYGFIVKANLMANKSTNYPDTKIKEVFRKIYLNKGVSPSEELVNQTVKIFRILSTNYIGIYDGVLEVLDLIKSKDKKIFLLSNGQREFSIPELKYVDIYKYFDGMYFSADICICKPDEKFFYHLIKEENINVEDSLMIGNDYTSDITGANNVSMDSIYIQSNHSSNIYMDIKCKEKIFDNNFRKIEKYV
ncbi:putative hydrolase of the HAD superfamily [Clostridium acidisoli DSM 12555]|uniref:Putative hydrolase of the HAD superfamily n=1 Tax=Clostridium acidisoli DSM 12555 TaxID=1121291 RepID=A0A1W1XPZ2_9CLOT|nr:HAD family hydrolase [Clostridium acidisoli]SMC26039.1 putative hydrolase of the HAD superfamily [Clostridium acidisoli DSM 12555]